MNSYKARTKEEKSYFEKIDKLNKTRKKDGKCNYPGCKKHAINSHTISKKSNLNNITENNMVMHFCPIRKGEDKFLELNEIGIRKASAFQGFCNEHDALFYSIDNIGIKTYRDLILQCYRSICFWLHHLIIDGKTIGEIQKYADSKIRMKFKELNIEFDYDEFRYGKEFQEAKIDFLEPIFELKKNLEHQLDDIGSIDEINKKNIINIDDVEIFHCNVNEIIPTVLNTISTVRGGHIFQIVFPNNNTTDIIVINATHGKVKIAEAWLGRTSNMLSLISLIETWMVSNEEWYIKPSIITKIPDDRLHVLTEDIRFWQGEHKLWEEYDMSIFDDLRNKYLELYKNTGYLSNEFEQKERRKFFPPSRPNNELREQNMRYKIALMQFYGDFGNA